MAEKYYMGLNFSEAAAECRVSDNTFAKWVKSGRVPYIRIGRKYIFNRELLNEFLKGQSRPPPGTTPT